ncbi:hypothetical protein AND_004667 [Anopheles darlingi]|uniref:Uncharacterized protein n=1 Tax=Anopheles darlingi TaxID=43151 RepID=W5JL23_ANODA|nr:hypothetical protein AND_004667 [Anopheles darlingi]
MQHHQQQQQEQQQAWLARWEDAHQRPKRMLNLVAPVQSIIVAAHLTSSFSSPRPGCHTDTLASKHPPAQSITAIVVAIESICAVEAIPEENYTKSLPADRDKYGARRGPALIKAVSTNTPKSTANRRSNPQTTALLSASTTDEDDDDDDDEDDDSRGGTTTDKGSRRRLNGGTKNDRDHDDDDDDDDDDEDEDCADEQHPI